VLQIINTGEESLRGTILILNVHWSDAGRVAQVMEKYNYSNVEPFFCYKPQQNYKGVHINILSVDTMLVGYGGGRTNCRLQFPEAMRTPRERHNHFLVGNVTKKLVDASDSEVNPCQKNPSIAYRIARRFMVSGDKALVIGAGTGSEVIGFAAAGHEVVAVEKDAAQVIAMRSRLQMCSDPNDHTKRDILNELDQIDQVKRMSQRLRQLPLTNNEPVMSQLSKVRKPKSRRLLRVDEADEPVESHPSQLSEEDPHQTALAEGEQDSSAEPPASPALASPVTTRSRQKQAATAQGDGFPKCPDCGLAIEEGEGMECSSDSCVLGQFHTSCLLPRQECTQSACDKRFCNSQACKEQQCSHVGAG
jgi:hypothetical protein